MSARVLMVSYVSPSGNGVPMLARLVTLWVLLAEY